MWNISEGKGYSYAKNMSWGRERKDNKLFKPTLKTKNKNRTYSYVARLKNRDKELKRGNEK